MKTRIISAAVAIALLVVVLIFHNTIALPATVCFLVVVAIYELLKAAGVQKYKVLTASSMIFGGSVPLVWFGSCVLFENTAFLKYLVPIEIFVYLMVLFCCLLAYYKTIKYEKLFFAAFETFFVTAALSCILVIHEFDGLIAVILTLGGAWLSDSGAYFAGTFLGRHKLCPNISPKKTVEGVIGGVVSNGILMCVIALVYSFIDDKAEINYILLFVAGCICSILGLLGDLKASLIKRQAGIKDYGNIMPGHGGVMDRFDSVLTVAPFMTLVFWLFDII
ncbi:MAG: phosphatidate cytidylyltransferase [Ruminococcus sp.]|nr:phosphatidate cytidylyltransferase [Ruminococcus sp.]